MFTIFPELDSVPRAIVDAQSQHAAAKPFHVGDVVLLQSGEGNGDCRGGMDVEILKPLPEGAAAVRVRVLPHFDHHSW